MPHSGVAHELASIKEPGKRYTKGEFLGRGASKVVYKAFDEVEGIEVAWNEVLCSDACLGSAKERSRMLGEITMLRQLKHRNIMRLYDYWYDPKGQVLVFITELLTDGSLRRFLRRKHAAGITLSVLKRYAWQILQGLVYLHGHYPPIIHRDLKCDNIFVNGASGELKLGDLGFATLLRGMSAPLSVIGTPEFIAPEVYDEVYDDKADVYSYGMCLLELATLEYPYSECTNPAQIYRKVTQGVPPAALAKLTNQEVRDFITLAIDRDPARRPEARQLLVHPFFEDVRQAIRARGWAKGPAPALGAAAAAAATVRNAAAAAAAAAGGGGGDGQQLAAGGAAPDAPQRVPLSAPDGLAAIAAAVDAAAAAEAAAAGGAAQQQDQQLALLPPQQLPQQDQQQGIEPLPLAVAEGLAQLEAAAGAGEVSLARSWPSHDPGRSCNAVLMQAALSEDAEQQQVQQQQQQQQAGVPQPAAAAAAAAAAEPEAKRPRGGSAPPPAVVVRTSSAGGDGIHSPFADACCSSFASTSSSWGAGGGAALAAATSAASTASRGARSSGGGGGSPVSGRHHHAQRPSLDEMSEEDVLFDTDSQGHAGDADSEADDGGGADGGGGGPRDANGAWHFAGGGSGGGGGAPAATRQHSYLGTIRESREDGGEDGGGEDDGDEEDEEDEEDEGVDCYCRQIDQQQLSFNVGYFTKGMRKRVGFQYNADEDTVDNIALEMLENLSLMPHQAAAIAEKIQAALEALGLAHGSNGGKIAAAAAADIAAASAASPSAAAPSPPRPSLLLVATAGGAAAPAGAAPLIGESAAIAIVATAAASAAIESCGTPRPGASEAGSAPASVHSGCVLDSDAAQAVAAAGESPAAAAAAAGSPGTAAAAAASTASSAGSLDALAVHVCPQQLVRELSLLHRDAGEALLHNLQEDLRLTSLAMPEAAAAVGVELGVSLPPAARASSAPTPGSAASAAALPGGAAAPEKLPSA